MIKGLKLENYGFVYIWRDKKYNRYYIGCHWGTEDDGYICSSTWMRDAYKRRPEDFKRRIIYKIKNRKEMFEQELKVLSKIKKEELGIKYYNFQKISPHWSSDQNKWILVKEKLSKSLSGEKHPNFGKHRSEETKKKIGNSNRGREYSEESLKNFSKGQKKAFKNGKIPWNKGLKLSEEHKNKLSQKKKEFYKNGGESPTKGKKMSDETKEKISISKKRKNIIIGSVEGCLI